MIEEKIRNFAIISHIDHGKSTLADRFLELTGTVTARKMQAQYLDQMDLEREKGITIKLTPVRMEYTIKNPKSEIRNPKQIPNLNIQNSKPEEDLKFILNLIDTPGHADFQYEVSRSLACVEGAILLVDATQGIQAQTLSNLYQAVENNLEIIPVINKIDLPNADVEKTIEELKNLLGCKEEEIISVSAKCGTNVDKIFAEIIKRIPEAKINNAPFRALIFDSVYDDYRGVIAYARVFDGEIKAGDKVKFFATDKAMDVLEVGVFKPQYLKKDKLISGEIGYIVTGLKEIRDCRVGDTVAAMEVKNSLPGYKKIKPIVFANFYPEEAGDFMLLRESLEKLQLSDASLNFEPKFTPALGRGFQCGFLGLLHLEIIQERLKREFNLRLVITTPSASYKVSMTDGSEITIYNPQDLPNPSYFKQIREPWVKLDVVTPSEFIGPIMELVQNYRGSYLSTEYLGGGTKQRLVLHYEMPLSSLISDFYDKLKSATSGFASVNYEILDFRAEDLVKLEVLVAGDAFDAFARIVPRDEANNEGKNLVNRLKNVIPQQNFPVAIQAAIGGKILARETIKALRKDVIAKLYGGDVTRKMKLLEKQKKGKKKMLKKGKVNIPQEVYLEVLKKD